MQSEWSRLLRSREKKEFEIETSAERQKFEAEVGDAEERGYSVEFVTRGSQIMVIMEPMGDILGKASAKKAMDRALDGGDIITYTNLILHAEPPAGLLGRLNPDISCYRAGFTSDFRGATPPHPHTVVEIDWIEDANAALNKISFYFEPTFVAPDGSMVMEVWNLLLTRAAPTVPALTTPEHTHTLPFASMDAILDAATTAGAEEPTIIVFHHRHNAFPPSYGVLDWNTSLAAPIGSLFTGRLDSNTILRTAYLSTTRPFLSNTCTAVDAFPPLYFIPHSLTSPGSPALLDAKWTLVAWRCNDHWISIPFGNAL
jgi:hypothetical protein